MRNIYFGLKLQCLEETMIESGTSLIKMGPTDLEILAKGIEWVLKFTRFQVSLILRYSTYSIYIFRIAWSPYVT